MQTALKVVAVGDNVLDRYVDLGVGYAGGSALNFGVGASAEGVEAAYIGAVSLDGAGDFILTQAADAGVELSRVRRYAGDQATTDVRVEANGNRTFLTWTQAPLAIILSDEDRALIGQADLVHTGHSSHTEDLVPELASLTALSFDFSYRGFDEARLLLPHLHAASFSASGLRDEDAVAFARRVHEAGPSIVILTRGAHGAVVLSNGAVHIEPAEDVNPVVDTLGAGDVFIAVVLVRLANGSSLADAASAASAASAAVCSRIGAFGDPYPLLASNASQVTQERGEAHG